MSGSYDYQELLNRIESERLKLEGFIQRYEQEKYWLESKVATLDNRVRNLEGTPR